MQLNSKFEPLQKVWPIRKDRAKEFIPCGFCNQTGEIQGVNGVKASCPKCYGHKGRWEYNDLEWQTGPPVTIGRIQLTYTAGQAGIPDEEMFDNMGPQQESVEEEYMCIETGIGSGSVYHGERLFASAEEAEAECRKRNGENEEDTS